MEAMMEVFPVMISALVVLLLIVLIILIVKLIGTVDKANHILDDIESKTQSLNGLFHVIDSVTDTLAVFSDSVVSTVTSIIGKVIPKKKRKSVKEEEDYE